MKHDDWIAISWLLVFQTWGWDWGLALGLLIGRKCGTLKNFWKFLKGE